MLKVSGKRFLALPHFYFLHESGAMKGEFDNLGITCFSYEKFRATCALSGRGVSLDGQFSNYLDKAVELQGKTVCLFFLTFPRM